MLGIGAARTDCADGTQGQDSDQSPTSETLGASQDVKVLCRIGPLWRLLGWSCSGSGGGQAPISDSACWGGSKGRAGVENGTPGKQSQAGRARQAEQSEAQSSRALQMDSAEMEISTHP